MRCLIAAVAACLLTGAAPALAQGPLGPLNDLGALSQGPGQTPDKLPIVKRDTPTQEAAPRAQCGPGSKPEPSIQGRVPAGSATDGLWCNVTQISHFGVSGGFKVQRYVDRAGRECAYYDTALLFPANALNVNTSGIGVAVLDMGNPAKPQQTALLTDPAMLSPHESVLLNQRRGLLAAVTGNPSTYPGYVSIYDVSQDCRTPVLQSSGLLARLGHESGFALDGKTFYATGTATTAITAIDVTDPKNPRAVWQGNVASHGMSLSDDGDRAYIADPLGRDLLILDTSEIQARKPDPQAREISRTTWNRASIPQNAIPFTENGHPYVLEIDEYNASTLSNGSPDDVGAARIIDIADEKAPQVVGNIRLQINQPAEHKQYGTDPGADGQISGGAQGYAGHYCNIPTRTNPKLVACSFIASGLRLFDISDVTKPREVGYFVAPPNSRAENGGQASDFAMSMPAFVPERHEIWYTDGTSGFYALRVADAAWPRTTGSSAARRCRTKGRVRVRLPRGAKVMRVRVKVAGRSAKPVRVSRAGRTLRVDVRRRHAAARVVVRVTLKAGRTITARRSLRPC